MNQTQIPALASSQPDAQPPMIACIGIDWADQEHAFHLRTPNGTTQIGTVKQDAAEIRDIIQRWRQQCPSTTLAIAIESSKGPLINALLMHEGVEIYPVNPAALAAYRKAFAHGGGKNDPNDAMLLCQYLHHYRSQLRPLQQNSSITTELASLGEDRRHLVDQRTALCNELKAALKLYFPVVLALDAAKSYADFIVRFLTKYPSLAEAQKAGETKLRKFFFGVGAKRTAQQRVELIVNAIPLTTNEVTIRCCARKVTAIIDQIRVLNASIDRYEHDIQELVKQHDDYHIVASLPGAADNTHCRIIAALGDDRSRFENEESLQAATGIAPLTHQSGKQRSVTSRWACSKFLRQTFHEFAGLSVNHSKWAKAYYDQQRSAGKSTHAARRALAYKWLRIIFRCWKDRVPYNEEHYLQRLKDMGSPLAKLIT